MSVYMYGSSAVQEKVKLKQPIRIRETKRKVYRNRSIPTQEKLLYLFTVVLCVIVAGTIIWRYSQIYEMNTKIHNIEISIKQIQAENDSLKLKLNKANHPDKLKMDAVTSGLKPTDPDQITLVPAKQVSAKSNNPKVAMR